MAEFKEVARQFKRMCDTYMKDGCKNCIYKETYDQDQVCAEYVLYSTTPDAHARSIMKWAAEHPEPRYPTWAEWQKTFFPEADSISELKPCMFKDRSYFNCDDHGCNDCRNRVMPESIAIMLGITPRMDWEWK